MKLGIIIGSLRQGRVTEHLAQSIADRAKQMEGVEVKLIDLAELQLPMFDEAVSPKFNQDRATSGSVKQWLDDLLAVDAVVVTTPEYNKSIPGALKNAFDFIAHEVDDKPFALAAHGSSGGAFSIAQLRAIVPELGGVTIPKVISLPYGSYNSDGNFSGDVSERDKHIDEMLDRLKAYSGALTAIRK